MANEPISLAKQIEKLTKTAIINCSQQHTLLCYADSETGYYAKVCRDKALKSGIRCDENLFKIFLIYKKLEEAEKTQYKEHIQKKLKELEAQKTYRNTEYYAEHEVLEKILNDIIYAKTETQAIKIKNK